MPVKALCRFRGTGLVATLILLLVGATTNAEELEITGYRIVMDDCGSACGPVVFDSEQAVSDYLSATNRARQAMLANAAGEKGSGGTGGNGLALGQRDNAPQLVFLDFDAQGPTFTLGGALGPFFGTFLSHAYTQEERNAVQARLESDYAAFNIDFTQVEPDAGPYTTLSFGCGVPNCMSINASGGISILFGRADNIDNLNTVRSDNAFIDPNFWEFLAQFNPGFFYALTGISPSGNLEADVSIAVVNQSSNTGAHELGHILGLRHHDSFGPPGSGLPSTGVPDPNAFIPIYDGPQDGDESILHLMASGASVGLPINGSSSFDRFFSERSNVKLATNQRGRIVAEAHASKGTTKLFNLVTANTVEIGDNAGGGIDVDAVTITGNISVTGETDKYRFKGKAGTFVTVDMISFVDFNIANPVIGALELYVLNGDGSRSLVASNLQTFEPFDPLIVDAELPADGTYEIEVTAPNIIFFDFTGDGIPDPFPLDETGLGNFRFGDYFLNIYSATGKLGSGPSNVPGPGT